MSGASWPIIVTFGGITAHGLKMHLGDFLPSVPGCYRCRGNLQ
jgi:hypothetical protein